MIEPLRWSGNRIRYLDQRLLPHAVSYVETGDYRDIIEAIRTLAIRGAPLIGITVSYGLSLAAQHEHPSTLSSFKERMFRIANEFASVRPTAINPFHALDEAREIVAKGANRESIVHRLRSLSISLHRDDAARCASIAIHGAALLKMGFNILTHCNTGRLATGGGGTALHIIVHAQKLYGNIHVYVDETRPLLQGSRLTAWELTSDGIPFTLITDSTAAFLMKRKSVQAVIVGADRIATNGDTANKIGSYSLALSADCHNIPFYVAAPLSTIDPHAPDGDCIPIEERPAEEIRSWNGKRVAPAGSSVYSPAFDVTPHQLIKAIITEKGILYPPFEKSIASMYRD